MGLNDRCISKAVKLPIFLLFLLLSGSSCGKRVMVVNCIMQNMGFMVYVNYAPLLGFMILCTAQIKAKLTKASLRVFRRLSSVLQSSYMTMFAALRLPDRNIPCTTLKWRVVVWRFCLKLAFEACRWDLFSQRRDISYAVKSHLVSPYSRKEL